MMCLHIKTVHKDLVVIRSNDAIRDVANVLSGANDDHPSADANEDRSHLPDASRDMISLADANDVYRPPCKMRMIPRLAGAVILALS